MVKAVDLQRVDTLEKKLCRTLPPLWILWQLIEVENEESNFQVAGGSRNNGSLKREREHLKVVEGRPVTEVLD